MPNRHKIIHFDAGYNRGWDKWPCRVNNLEMSASRHDCRLLLFDYDADPTAILAGDLKSHRIEAPGWKGNGKQVELDLTLKAEGTAGEVGEFRLSWPGMEPFQEYPKIIYRGAAGGPFPGYIAIRQGGTCVLLVQRPQMAGGLRPTMRYPLSTKVIIPVDRNDLDVVLDGLKPGMSLVFNGLSNQTNGTLDWPTLVACYNTNPPSLPLSAEGTVSVGDDLDFSGL